jgi:hypothetical protein
MQPIASAAAFAVVYDVAASWTRYPGCQLSHPDGAIAGLLLHAAGATDDGFRIIDVWESEDAFARHRPGDRPAVPEAVVPPVVRELRVLHIVIGIALGDPSTKEDHT